MRMRDSNQGGFVITFGCRTTLGISHVSGEREEPPSFWSESDKKIEQMEFIDTHWRESEREKALWVWAEMSIMSPKHGGRMS